MLWSAPRTVSRLAPRTCAELRQAGLLGCRQHRRGPSLPDSAEPRPIWVQGPSKQWLHLPSAQCLAKDRKPLAAPPPQDPRAKGVRCRGASSSGAAARGSPSEKKEEVDPLQDKSISLYQRFKKTFRQYGKVLIPVHLITSGVWFGTFYYAAMKGVNLIPFLELLGLPDSVVGILKDSQSGNALTAYAMFKLQGFQSLRDQEWRAWLCGGALAELGTPCFVLPVPSEALAWAAAGAHAHCPPRPSPQVAPVLRSRPLPVSSPGHGLHCWRRVKERESPSQRRGQEAGRWEPEPPHLPGQPAQSSRSGLSLGSQHHNNQSSKHVNNRPQAWLPCYSCARPATRL